MLELFLDDLRSGAVTEGSFLKSCPQSDVVRFENIKPVNRPKPQHVLIDRIWRFALQLGTLAIVHVF